jgi:hypothetical protein
MKSELVSSGLRTVCEDLDRGDTHVLDECDLDVRSIGRSRAVLCDRSGSRDRSERD